MCVHNPDQKITITVTNYDGLVVKKDFHYSVRYKEAKHLYELRITLGTKLNGSQDQKSFYGHTVDEAIAKARRFLELTFGYYPPTPRSVSEYVQTYIDDHSSMISDSTLSLHKSYLKNQIKPILGNIMLSALDARMIEEFSIILLKKPSLCSAHQAEGKKRNLSKKTVINILSFLHKVLEKARREKLIDENPVPVTSKLDFKYDYPDAAFLPRSLFTHFCNAIANSPYRVMYLFILFTGLRLAEALGLRMIDLDDCFLTVRHQLQRIVSSEKINDQENIIISDRTINRKNKPSRIVHVLRRTKGRRERRIYYTPFVKSLLKSIVKHMRSIPMSYLNTEQLLFVQSNGQHYSKTSIEKDFRKCMDEYSKANNVDLTQLNVHSLRHTYLTWLMDTGVDNSLAARMAGHSSPAITEKIYHHLSVDAINSYIQHETELQGLLCSKVISIADLSPSALNADSNIFNVDDDNDDGDFLLCLKP